MPSFCRSSLSPLVRVQSRRLLAFALAAASLTAQESAPQPSPEPTPEPERTSVIVTADDMTPEAVKSSAHFAEGQAIFKSAGTLQDVSRFVQALPGVAIGSDDFRNDIIVRGGSPLENLFLIDNVEVPNINTFANFASAGGTVSILDPSLIQDVVFLTGGYPAPYINRTSSVLQVTQREGARDRVRGRLNVLFGGVGGNLEGPINKGKGSWIAGARRSFLDLLTDDTGIGGVPKLSTFNGKALYDFTPNDRLWVVSIAGIDSIRLGLTEDNRGDLEEELANFDIRYAGKRWATGVNWQHLFGASGLGLLGLTHSEARVDSSVRDVFLSGFGPGSTEDLIGRSPVVFREDSREGETTAKYDLTASVPRVGRLQMGGSLKAFQVSYNTASPLGNDTPYSTQPGLSPFFLERSFTAYQSGAYVQTSWTPWARLSLTAGGRLDNYSYLRSTRFSPRAGASLQITERLSWYASFGHYHQQPFFLFLAAFPQNRALIPFRSVHYISGMRYRWPGSVQASAEVYRKTYDGYPVAADLPELSLANLGDTFNVREILFPLVSGGRGRVQGIEFLIERRGTGRWFGQANFSLSSARHAGLDGVPRPGSFNYSRIFNAIGGYRLTDKWEIATRVLYLSGRPYTAYDEALSAEQRRGVYDLNRVNSQRLPDYFRVDIRLDRTFTVRGRPLLVFFGAQNITNRRNLAGYRWNRRLSQVDAAEQLGIFPLAGFEWRF